MEERGFFDAVRCELWSVIGCRLPLELLKARLRITSRSRDAKSLETLTTLGLLRQDDEGYIYDEVQAHEFAAAVAQAVTNTVNGKKGGRPARKSPQEPLGTTPSADSNAGAGDF
jgi:hypothetical protein